MRRLFFSLACLLACSVSMADGVDDDVLDGFIRAALEKNPGVRAMTYRVEASRAAWRRVRSAWLPRLDASASYMVTDNPPQAFMMNLNQRSLDMGSPGFDFNEPDDTANVRLSLGAKYRLYDGARGARIGGAAVASQIAAAREAAVRNTLVHEVTRGYYRILEAQAFVAVQTAALTSLEESLRVAGERFDSGSAVKTDVLNLEVKTAQARENLIRARNGVQLAIAALNTAIGDTLVDEAGLQTPSLAPVKPAGMPSGDADAVRPEMRASELEVAAAAWELKAAQRSRGPVLNAFGSVDWDSEDLGDPERSYMGGVALEWEWFSGFESRARVDEARLFVQAAEAAREQLRHELALDQRQASLGLEEAWARLQVTSQAVGSAEEALRITREQYKEGAAEIAVLLVAELGLTETRMRDTAAMYDYQIAKSNRDRALGRLAKGY